MTVKKSPASSGEVTILNPPGKTEAPASTDIVLDAQLKKEIAKIDVSKQAVVGLVKKYGALVQNPISNKKEFEIVDDARKLIKSKAVAVENKRKAINETYLKITKGVNKYAGELSKPLRGLEDLLEDHCNVWETEQAAEKLRQEQAAEKLLNEKVTKLEEAGLKFTGVYYAIGENIALDIVTIKGLDDENYNALLQTVANEKKRLDDIAQQEADEKKRLDDIAQQEADEKKRLEKEQEDERQRLEDRHIAQENEAKELQRQRDELNDMLAEANRTKISNRQTTLIGHGFTYDPTKGYFIYKHFADEGNVMVYDTSISDSTPDDWAQLINKAIELKTKVSEQNIKEAERLQLITDRKNARVADLKALGFIEIAGGYRITSEMLERNFDVVNHDIEEDTVKDFNTRFANISKMLSDWHTEVETLKKEQAAKKEKERKGALSDYQKVSEYIAGLQLERKNRPEITNNDLKFSLVDFENQISNTIAYLEEAAENIIK